MLFKDFFPILFKFKFIGMITHNILISFKSLLYLINSVISLLTLVM